MPPPTRQEAEAIAMSTKGGNTFQQGWLDESCGVGRLPRQAKWRFNIETRGEEKFTRGQLDEQKGGVQLPMGGQLPGLW